MNKKQYIQPNVKQVTIGNQSLICFSTTDRPADPSMPQLSKDIPTISMDDEEDIE